MGWQGQRDFEHGKERTYKTFRLTIGQVGYFFEGQYDFNRFVVLVKLTAMLLLTAIQPGPFKIIRQPEGNRASLRQGSVMVRPVLDTV